MRRSRVAQTKQYDPRLEALGKSKNFSKVQIEGQNNPRLGNRFLENFAVRQSLETFFTEVSRIMPLQSEPANHTHIHSHIGKDTHPLALWEMHLFLS